MYDMKNSTFGSFIDFLKANPCNIKQTTILIKLGFFSEFGKSQKLLDILDIYNSYYGKTQFLKSKVEDISDIVKKYSRETEKKYILENADGFIQEMCERVENKSISVKEYLSAENEYLGYVDYVNPDLKDYGFVLDIDTKYSPKLTVYNIGTGNTDIYKVSKNTFACNPISPNDIIKFSYKKEFRKRLVDGKWISCTDQYDNWIEQYTIKR